MCKTQDSGLWKIFIEYISKQMGPHGTMCRSPFDGFGFLGSIDRVCGDGMGPCVVWVGTKAMDYNDPMKRQ